MDTNRKDYLLLLNLFAYLAVIAVNMMATFGSLGGRTTAQISDQYVSLFTPSGFTFSIWSVIYLLLGIYTIYQLRTPNNEFVKMIAPFYFMSSIFNILWILAWHYSTPFYSLIAILLLLGSLLIIVKDLKGSNLLTRTTFSIYCAWITVASIASLFIYLASVSDLPYNSTWYLLLANIALCLVGLLAFLKGSKNKDIPYILTLIWAIIGILVKHVSVEGFNGEYVSIIFVGIVAIIVALVEIVMIGINYLKN